MEPSVSCSNSASVEDKIFPDNHIRDMIVTFQEHTQESSGFSQLCCFPHTAMDFPKEFEVTSKVSQQFWINCPWPISHMSPADPHQRTGIQEFHGWVSYKLSVWTLLFDTDSQNQLSLP